MTEKRTTEPEDDTGPGWPPDVGSSDVTTLPSERPASIAEKFVRSIVGHLGLGAPKTLTPDQDMEDPEQELEGENTTSPTPTPQIVKADTEDGSVWSDAATLAPTTRPPLDDLKELGNTDTVIFASGPEESIPSEPIPPPIPSRRAMSWPEGELVVRCEVNGRDNNEDSFHIFALTPEPGAPTIPVLTLADGMGGHAHGEHASRETLRQFAMAVFEMVSVNPSQGGLSEESVTTATVEQAFRYAAQKANTTLRRIIEQNNWGYAGATLVAAAIMGDSAVIINVGDSPLFHIRPSEGTISQVSEDHSRAGVLVKAGLITPEMARFHEGRSQLLYHIGAKDLPDIEAKTIDLKTGDLLLLVSDGVTGNATPQEIADRLCESLDSLDDAADRLISAARDAGESDNQTIVLYRHCAKPIADLFRQPTVYLGS